MAFLMNWFRSKPVVPDRVATDTVIPLFPMDDTGPNRAIVVDFTMRFDDKLDVQQLVGALEKLLRKPGWKKLGARLRQNNLGKLEYHVPADYTTQRPALQFTHVTHGTSLSEHALASQLHRSNGSVEVTEILSKFRPLLFGPDHPTKAEDWFYVDRPQLQLHVVSFNDATLVTLTWLHTLLDAMGRRALLTAWTAILEGREDDVPEIYGYDTDPLATFGKDGEPEKQEKSVLEDKVLKGWGLFKFIVNYIWEIMVYSEELRMICVPPAFFKRVKENMLDDLRSESPDTIITDMSNPAAPKPFLSDGDILSAWYMRLITSCQPWVSRVSPKTTILYMNPFGLRQVLESTEPKLLPKGKAYIANCVMAIHSYFSVDEVLSLPLGFLAARLRKDISIQGTRAQCEALARLHKNALAKGKPNVFGTPDMSMVVLSNWSKAKMFETDFSAAVLEEGSVEHLKGKPTYIQCDGSQNGISIRNAGPILGRDWQGNYWIGVMARPETWKNMEKAIRDMQ
ncbi:hypothetical protein K491DRAFT_588653 [Lophiostoma macrostomum CBS 122681]|uniref:LysR family regulatory protein n=1 Tax=Lophiostoma macrostomum CBS 122681 TaxID=1314788 RepID=A0A6A6TNF1_9PLEO|nr:hypothetical protein K491DRAFT_588653 [Lophiostoma macrostomum CBS 122681]